MSPLCLHPHLYDAVWVQARQYDIDYELVAAIINQESGFNPLAFGDQFGSYGLGQLNLDGAGAGHSPSRLLEVDYNLEVAVAYLRNCLDAYPDELARAIAAYNRGISGAAQLADPGSDPYVLSVLAQYHHYLAIGIERRIVWAQEE